MNNPEPQIPGGLFSLIFSDNAGLFFGRQADAEAKISPEFIQQAEQEIQARQIQAR